MCAAQCCYSSNVMYICNAVNLLLHCSTHLSEVETAHYQSPEGLEQNLLQITDGAAAVLLMTRREALKRHLPILGIFRSFAAVGVDPAVMGIGPAVAIPAAVKSAGLTIDDIDLFELNEAFASQVMYSM